MLEKHCVGTATSTRCHEQQQHRLDNFDSSSPEPRLKIKISRLKDGSGSFSLHNGFSNSEASFSKTHKLNSQSPQLHNHHHLQHSQLHHHQPIQQHNNHQQQGNQGDDNDEVDDGEETEEEDYGCGRFDLLPKKSKLDARDDLHHQTQLPQHNGQHRNLGEKPVCDKSSDKENKMALRSSRGIKVRVMEDRIDDSDPRVKSGQRKIGDSKSVGCSTEVDLLGPCQPGTLIRMPGMVWSDSSENGMLLFKTLWKDKPFIGMLIEVGQGEEWSMSKSRVLNSCPGSRYKRKCKKPREFRYVDGWYKRGKNVRHRTSKATDRSCLDTSLCSIQEDDPTYNPNQFLVCPHDDCRKKFANDVARRFHVSYAHKSSLCSEKPKSKALSTPNHHSNGSPPSAFEQRADSFLISAGSLLDTPKSIRNKRRRRLSQSSSGSARPSSTTSTASFATNSEGPRASAAVRSTAENLVDRGSRKRPHYSLEDVSDCEDESRLGSSQHPLGGDLFYTSAVNPTSLVIRRALKVPRDVTEPASSVDPNGRGFGHPAPPPSSVIEHSGFSSRLESSTGFFQSDRHQMLLPSVVASPYAPASQAARSLPPSPELLTTFPVSDPPYPTATPSWLDHYPHSISAALTMSLLSMSKTPSSKFDECPPLDAMEVPPSIYGKGGSLDTHQRLTGQVSQDDNVPKMGHRPQDSPNDSSKLANCPSPVYSDISDTVDRTPLFANPSKVVEAQDVVAPWSHLTSPSYPSAQFEALPLAMPVDQSRVIAWLDRSTDQCQEPSFHGSGYTSYLQQILCNKEKFYESLAFGSPSDSPRGTTAPLCDLHTAEDRPRVLRTLWHDDAT